MKQAVNLSGGDDMKLEEATILALQGKLNESKDIRLTVYEIVNRVLINLEHNDLVADYKVNELDSYEENKISFNIVITLGEAQGLSATYLAKDLQKELEEKLTGVNSVSVSGERYTHYRTHDRRINLLIDIVMK